MACIVVIEGPATGTYFALGTHKVVDVGRDEECVFQILDPLVSRHHLQVRSEGDGKHIVADSHSANGVLVNGTRIAAETALKDGDEIKIGATKMIYSLTDYPDAKRAVVGVRSGRQWKSPTIMSKGDPTS